MACGNMINVPFSAHTGFSPLRAKRAWFTVIFDKMGRCGHPEVLESYLSVLRRVELANNTTVQLCIDLGIQRAMFFGPFEDFFTLGKIENLDEFTDFLKSTWSLFFRYMWKFF